ncbi:MAG TPA: PepSY domain-containing protein [Duganella sp.]|nr:PepSY domain-containing protein [Duganella sp.]
MTLVRRCAAIAAFAALATSGAAFADNDCTDSISEWKPRELLRQEVERRGWTVQRIKVDDGCYEVRGTDRLGNRVKAKYAPASLRMRSLEVEFGPNGDASDYAGPVQAKENRRERIGPTTKGNIQ